MGIKLWNVEFGWNTDKRTVEAKDIQEAINKANKYVEEMGMPKEDVEKDYWISTVEIIAEEDE